MVGGLGEGTGRVSALAAGRERIWRLGALFCKLQRGEDSERGKGWQENSLSSFPKEMTFVCSVRQHKGNVCASRAGDEKNPQQIWCRSVPTAL